MKKPLALPGSRLTAVFVLSMAACSKGEARDLRSNSVFGGAGGRSVPDAASGDAGGASGNTGPIGSVSGPSGTVDPDAGTPDAEPTPFCGDGLINRADERCDDGNMLGGDGCTPTCEIEANYVCPTPGQPCVTTVHCGDGIVNGPEQCDDRNTAAGDGCDGNCQIERGWVCPPSAPCQPAACGDGLLAGSEQCDDGNIVDGDGCTANCKLESAPNGQKDGWKCPVPGQPCVRTNCGDRVVEGSEQCDDPAKSPFNGCSWTCGKEPDCGFNAQMQYGCTAVCGDGMVFPGEACDDGNVRDGDGCSHDCQVEPGYSCLAQRPPPPNPLYMPVIYRDFTPRHPQFEVSPNNDGLNAGGRRQPGIAQAVLGPNPDPTRGRPIPVYNPAYIGLSLPPAGTATGGVSLGRPWTMDGPTQDAGGTAITDTQGMVFFSKTSSNPATLTTSAIGAAYQQWYTDVAGVNLRFQDLLSLGLIATGTYQFDRSASNPMAPQFFPLDGRGFGNVVATNTSGTFNHNFHFTSEVRYWFEFQGGERLEFRGDDDVWVFVNGQLSVDLGGIHGELRGVVTLGAGGSQFCWDDVPCTAAVGCNPAVDPVSCATSTFNLVQGNIYEIVVFQAERHITASNYKLTLTGFNAPRSECKPICGDGIVTGNEQCDLGAANNTGAYGTCNMNCTLGPHCGDAVTQTAAGEECDDGVNITTYGAGCAPGCKKAPFCGDGKVQSPDEQCDDGVNDGGYAECAPGCRYGDRCGDGVVQSDHEECDRGPLNGNSDCSVVCRLLMVK